MKVKKLFKVIKLRKMKTKMKINKILLNKK